MLDPRALKTYLTVCQEGSITGAARRLNLSQPAVSVTMAQLEEALGATLFERSRAGITLTPAGEALLTRAEAMDVLLRRAEEEVSLARHGVQGPLRIGGTPGALVSLIPEAISRLARNKERFALHILERNDSELLTLLRRGDIEIAVATTGVEGAPADIEERTVARDPFDLIVGESNAHLPAAMSLRDLQQFRWVLPEAAGAFRRQLDALFLAAEVPTPRDVIRCDSLLTTKQIVRVGEHVTILPRRVAAAELSVGVLRAIHISDIAISRNVGLRTLAGRRLSPLAEKLVEEIAAAAEY
jgi:DNA-binding transcriptional LysR family regulator